MQKRQAVHRALSGPTIRRLTINGEEAINIVVQTGVALCMASSILFHVRLYQLDTHLREYYPEVWKIFGSGNDRLHWFAQYNRITKLSTQYQVSDEALNRRFLTLRRLHQSGAIGVIVIICGILYDVLG